MTAGICGTGGAKITINGGEISGNIARYASASLPHRGSAISVSSGSTNYPAVLTINGGTITNNSSITGCAVSLNQHAAGYLNGGTITGNVSTSDYGGIVANGENGQRHLVPQWRHGDRQCLRSRLWRRSGDRAEKGPR